MERPDCAAAGIQLITQHLPLLRTAVQGVFDNCADRPLVDIDGESAGEGLDAAGERAGGGGRVGGVARAEADVEARVALLGRHKIVAVPRRRAAERVVPQNHHPALGLVITRVESEIIATFVFC
eukprot:6204015-Pleurochrysis_carterae.AAC.10